MTVIFRDFTSYIRSFNLARVLAPTWTFLNQLIPLYAWTTVYGVPLEYLDENLNPTVDPSTIVRRKE
jgi:hypothetical protein